MVFVGRRRPVLGLMAVSAVTGAAVRRNTPQPVQVVQQPAPQQVRVEERYYYQSAPPQQSQGSYQQGPPPQQQQQQYQQQQPQQQQQYQQQPYQQQSREVQSGNGSGNGAYVSQGPSQQHQAQVTQSNTSVSQVQASPSINEPAPAQHYQSQQRATPAPLPPKKTRGPTTASRAILKVLEETVQIQRLQGFYTSSQLDYISQILAENQSVSVIGNEWRLDPVVANDLVKLALYDVVLYLDDSSTMKSEDGGSKIGDVKYLVSSLAHVVGKFNDNGMKLRFINSPIEANNLQDEVVANDILSKVKFDGQPPSGKIFEGKVLEPLILGPAREQRLEKPVLVIVVTDRAPGAMVRDRIIRVVKSASEELNRTKYGTNAVSYQVTAIGDDPKLGKFLAVLDNNAEIGGLVDTTGGYESEAIAHLQGDNPVEISPELWLAKLLLGGIDPTYRNDL